MTPGIWRKPGVQCDFCSSPDVVRMYKCRDFDSDSKAIGVQYAGESVALFSVGEWASCGQCAKLIDAMDLEGLVNYVCRVFQAKHDLLEHDGMKLPSALRAHIAYTFELFFTNKI